MARFDLGFEALGYFLGGLRAEVQDFTYLERGRFWFRSVGFSNYRDYGLEFRALGMVGSPSCLGLGWWVTFAICTGLGSGSINPKP